MIPGRIAKTKSKLTLNVDGILPEVVIHGIFIVANAIGVGYLVLESKCGGVRGGGERGAGGRGSSLRDESGEGNMGRSVPQCTPRCHNNIFHPESDDFLEEKASSLSPKRTKPAALAYDKLN
jgi:hypothetical protein